MLEARANYMINKLKTMARFFTFSKRKNDVKAQMDLYYHPDQEELIVYVKYEVKKLSRAEKYTLQRMDSMDRPKITCKDHLLRIPIAAFGLEEFKIWAFLPKIKELLHPYLILKNSYFVFERHYVSKLLKKLDFIIRI